MISIGDRKLAFSASGVILAFVVAALAYSTATFAQNNDKVKAGLAIWKTTGCADCHGPFADGDREDDDFPIGANLRTSKLDPAALKMTIRCGRAGTGMPSFDDGGGNTRGGFGGPPRARPENLWRNPRALRPGANHLGVASLQARAIVRGKINPERVPFY